MIMALAIVVQHPVTTGAQEGARSFQTSAGTIAKASGAEPLEVRLVPNPIGPDERREKKAHDERVRRVEAETQAANFETRRLTFLQLVFAGVQTLVATVTLIGLWIAWKTAKSSADGVALAELMAKRQLRAYVSVDNISVSEFSVGAHPVIRFEMHNCGQTPATRMTTNYRFGTFGSADPWDENPPALEMGSRTFLAAGARTHATERLPLPLSALDVQSIDAGTREFRVFGIVEYVDIFGDRHHTTFRNRSWAGRGLMVSCPEGNEVT